MALNLLALESLCVLFAFFKMMQQLWGPCVGCTHEMFAKSSLAVAANSCFELLVPPGVHQHQVVRLVEEHEVRL